MRFRRPLAVAVIALAAACADDPTGSGPPVETNQVAVRDNFFSPANTVVTQGTRVTWTWQGSNPHNVTWNEPNPPNSVTQTSGTYGRTFNVPLGDYTYFCTIHAGMTGRVTVQ